MPRAVSCEPVCGVPSVRMPRSALVRLHWREIRPPWLWPMAMVLAGRPAKALLSAAVCVSNTDVDGMSTRNGVICRTLASRCEVARQVSELLKMPWTKTTGTSCAAAWNGATVSTVSRRAA